MIPLFVTGCGAVTALGLDAARTVASLRSGAGGRVVLPFAGSSGKDLRAAPVVGYAEGLIGPSRFVALAARALAECMPALRAEEPQTPVVYLGLPFGDRPGIARLVPFVSDALERRFALPRGAIRTVSGGRTSLFTAIKEAGAALRAGARACIVGAVDSLVHPSDLRHFSQQGVLAEEYDGFFPGEGAAFVCLSRRATIGPWGRKAPVLLGLGEANEHADGSASAPLVGVGMSAAMRHALDDGQVAEGAIGLCINAINGSRSEFEDEAHARIRLLRTPRDVMETWHLASSLGETGAAYGPLALIWASAALELGFSPATEVLISAAEGRHRAALVMRGAPGPLAQAGPVVGLLEPALHTFLPITSTAIVADDPGIRLGATDDRHRALAERDLDALAALLVIREAHLISDSPWTDIEPFEQRALSRVDALAWSGATARALVDAYLHGDPSEASAATLLLCSSASTGGQEIDLLLEACTQSPKHRARIATTAALCARAVAEPFLLRLVEVDEASTRDALWGLTIGRWLTPDWLAALIQRQSDPTPDIVVAIATMGLVDYGLWAAGWLASLGGPLPLETVLATTAVDPRWLQDLSPRDAIEFAPEALALASLQSGASVAALVAGGPIGAGAMIALGWSGEVQGAPILLAGLDSEEPGVAEEAARSLARIYGVRPLEKVIEDDNKVDRLSRDRKQWEEALKVPAAVGDRLRDGRRWHKQSALELLVNPRTSCSERTIAAWENAIVNRQPLGVHLRQWVATQRRGLTAVR